MKNKVSGKKDKRNSIENFVSITVITLTDVSTVVTFIAWFTRWITARRSILYKR